MAVFLLALPLFTEDAQRVSMWNIFHDSFNDPFEKVYILCYDGTIFEFDTGTDGVVGVSADFMLDIMKDKRKYARNISIIIHNHWGDRNFSPADKKVYWYFHGKGFRGAFLLYVQPLNIIKELPESRENRK